MNARLILKAKVKIAMTGKMLVKLLFLLMISEVLLFSVSEAKPWLWGSRRRRRRSRPTCDSSSPTEVAWVNKWQEEFTFDCPLGSYMTYWQSQHRNCKEDRIHYFKCEKSTVSYNSGNCAWTSYVNDYDQPVNFLCPHNGFITGVTSEYSSQHRDRRFGFHCCHVNGFKTHTCILKPYPENDWDQEVKYEVPDGYYLVGVHSDHHNHYEDRRWSFKVCQIGKKK
ncbi:hemagglutinin/amebocyte aggregation factor-like isoform X1 [Oculina patagonica]